jgi:hypothetical protein
MKFFLSSLVLLSMLLGAAPAAAQVAGAWHVNGKIDDRAFALDCRFDPNDSGFGGVCIETPAGSAATHPGKQHILTSGSVAGNQIGWTYQASFMLMSFSVNFAGTMSGDSITGTVTASGHSGPFTATRK